MLPARHLRTHRLRPRRGDRRLGPVHRRLSRAGPERTLLGQLTAKGSITETGNSHVRRLLVEAAWHHEPRYCIGATTHARWTQLATRKKTHTMACVAIARELAGSCWSLASLPDTGS